MMRVNSWIMLETQVQKVRPTKLKKTIETSSL